MSTQSHLWRAGALSVALIAVAACNRQPAAEPPPSTASVPPADSAQPAAANDAWITTKVQASYFADATVRGTAIDVDTSNAVVTLRGTVGTEAEKTQAVTLARQVEGVTRVDDQLEISAAPAATDARKEGAPGAAASGGDRLALGPAWITTKIQAQYFGDADVKPWNVDVDTASGGVVTLRGEVENEQARLEAVRIAKSTEGVTEVVDHLRVKGATAAAASPSGRAQDSTPSAAQPSTRQPAQPSEETLGDPWITAMIQSKYFIDDEVKGATIDVTTENGIVTLKGEVDSASERRQAAAIARSTTGVRDVRDQLTVKPASGTAAESRTASGEAARAGERSRDLGERAGDAWITTKIQSKYFLDPQIRALGIDVTTVNGVVTIKGAVDSAEARKTAETIARETEGVSRVVNSLTVKAESSS